MDESLNLNSSQPQNPAPYSQSPNNPRLSQNQPYVELSPGASPSQKKRKKVRRLLLFIFILAVLGFTYFFVDYRAIIDTIAGIGYTPDATMSQLIERISLSDSGDRILRASRPQLEDKTSFNQHCPTVSAKTSTLGCYYARHIYVYNIQNDDLDGIREVVLAHELLHAVWQRIDLRTRNDTIAPLLTEVYHAHRDLLESHMEYYETDDQLDELHSVIGTQISPDLMPGALREHYERYFSDHRAIVSLYDQYNGRFMALKSRSDELAAQISAKKTAIETKTSAYQTSYERLNADIEDFNSRAQDGYFSSQSNFTAERNSLIARQNRLSQEYAALSRLVDEANQLVAEYNKTVILQEELYSSIDSSAPAPNTLDT
ncbi:hypothetical protein IKF15_03555 [Candidatus Saccharibacteria bacterium]|nr:hypothetical protein [Candidatus Saccharibacteria bacterium]